MTQPPDESNERQPEKHSRQVPLRDVDVVRLASLDVHLVVENHDETLRDGTPFLELTTDDPNILRSLSHGEPQNQEDQHVLTVEQTFWTDEGIARNLDLLRPPSVATLTGDTGDRSLNAPEVPDELLQSRRWREGDVDTPPQGLPVVTARVPRGTKLEVADCLQSHLDHDGPLKVEVNADQWATINVRDPRKTSEKSADQPLHDFYPRYGALMDYEDPFYATTSIEVGRLGRVRLSGDCIDVSREWLYGEDLAWYHDTGGPHAGTSRTNDGRFELAVRLESAHFSGVFEIFDGTRSRYRIPPSPLASVFLASEPGRVVTAFNRLKRHSGNRPGARDAHRDETLERFKQLPIRPLRGQKWQRGVEDVAPSKAPRGPSPDVDDLPQAGRRPRPEPESSAPGADDDLPPRRPRAQRRPVHGNGSPPELPKMDLGDPGAGPRRGPRPGPTMDGP